MKIVYLAPHLSTGGCPQFILKRIQSLLAHTEGIEVYVIEHSFHGDAYVVMSYVPSAITSVPFIILKELFPIYWFGKNDVAVMIKYGFILYFWILCKVLL